MYRAVISPIKWAGEVLLMYSKSLKIKIAVDIIAIIFWSVVLSAYDMERLGTDLALVCIFNYL